MNRLALLLAIVLLAGLNACGADDSPEAATDPVTDRPQGLVSPAQRSALNSANAVEQTLLDSAEIRRQQLEQQLRDL